MSNYFSGRSINLNIILGFEEKYFGMTTLLLCGMFFLNISSRRSIRGSNTRLKKFYAFTFCETYILCI